MRDDFAAGDLGTVPLLAFGHTPFDARSASIAFLEEDAHIREAVTGCRNLGAHVYCVHTPGQWEIWRQAADAPQMLHRMKEEQLDSFFQSRRDVLNPTAIYRAKIDRTLTAERQREFVALDLLPRIEEQAGDYLVDVFARMVAACTDRLGWEQGPPNPEEAVWLIRSNFWLLAAKLLHDKGVPRFVKDFDLLKVSDVLNRVDTHYGASTRADARGRLPALRAAAEIMADTHSLRSLTTETLGALFEESLIDKLTRKKWGTHRTPTYLVDYILAKLAGPLGELIEGKDPVWLRQHLHILEPACGHAPFLTGMVGWLNALLPDEITANDTARRAFLRNNLHGIEADYFAYEVARLSLTVADIPNDNGWSLRNEDMFSGTLLSQSAAKAMMVISNPPFEAESLSPGTDPHDLRDFRKAAEVVRRTVQAMPDGGLFGFVLPQAFLDSPKARELRRWMLDHCEIFEIGNFAAKMFKFAEPETAIVLGRRHISKGAVPGVLYRSIRKKDCEEFIATWSSPARKLAPAIFINQPDASFHFAEMDLLWSDYRHLPTLGDFANIGKGFEFESNPSEPVTAEEEGNGYVMGFFDISGDPLTHLLPKQIPLNQRPEVLRDRGGGLQPPEPQVILNHGRVSRHRWRHKAFIDEVGRPTRGRFLTVRPTSPHAGLRILWALCNSPVANAFTYSQDPGPDVLKRHVSKIPVPDLSACDVAGLLHAVTDYLTQSKAFSDEYGIRNGIDLAVVRKKAAKLLSGSDTPEFGSSHFDPSAFLAASDHLRALHWRVDTEVLKLYALPPERERELLDFFLGIPRVGVPFVQEKGKEGYIPREFRGVQTLDDFLRITDEWDATNEERFALIEKKIAKQASRAELRRLVQLQRLLGARQDFYAPLPLRQLDADLARLEAKFGPLDDDDGA